MSLSPSDANYMSNKDVINIKITNNSLFSNIFVINKYITPLILYKYFVITP